VSCPFQGKLLASLRPKWSGKGEKPRRGGVRGFRGKGKGARVIILRSRVARGRLEKNNKKAGRGQVPRSFRVTKLEEGEKG